MNRAKVRRLEPARAAQVMGMPGRPAARTARSVENADFAEQFRRYGHILARNAVLIVVCTAVAVAASLAIGRARAPSYSATATVLVQSVPTDQVTEPGVLSARDAQRRVNTEVEVRKGQRVANRAAEQLGYRPSVRVVPVEQTDTIQVTATAPTADQAARDANVYVEAYVADSRERAVSDLEARLAELQQKITQLDQAAALLQAPLAELEERLQAADPASRSDLQAERRNLVARIETEKANLADQRAHFIQQRDRLEMALKLSSRGGPYLISAADAPRTADSPRPLRDASVAALLGLLVGVGLAFLRASLDESIRTKADLEAAAPSLPVLGVIPDAAAERPERTTTSIERRVIRVAEPASPIFEAFGVVRASIQFADLADEARRLIQVTSAEPADGKTSTVANLAASFAAAGYRVTAVCCDWRQPRLHDCFDLSNRVGFTSVLLGEVPLAEAVQRPPGRRNLAVLASGPLPPSPAELLGTVAAHDVLRALREASDLLIIDTPPVLAVSDPLVISSVADATLLVARSAKTPTSAVRSAIELLQSVGAPLLGTVLLGARGHDAYGEAYGSYRTGGTARWSSRARETTGKLTARHQAGLVAQPSVAVTASRRVMR